ncbi:DNA polymerase/3'-5' exonuclease PolX [Inquilinus sp. OTU3971]|uniref:DNA polymerase/3'-5' exonuclease PolX n=1 Tax=Inquilinus sp. OTU3971 TaxID=3043855 RepID=UPI00313D854D
MAKKTTPAGHAPPRNSEIADRFDDIATMLDLEGANQFRIRAYRNASRFLRRYGREASDMIAGGEDLAELPGIGDDLAGKIRDLVATGTTSLLDDLRAKTLPVSLNLMRIPGLGPKRIRALVDGLKIRSIGRLRQAAAEGRIRSLPRFGARLEQYLLRMLEERQSKSIRFPLSVAMTAARPLVAHLERGPTISRVVVAGSYRRGLETVGDLDILATAADRKAALDWFTRYGEVAEVRASGTTRATVLLRSGLQVDLRVVAEDSFGAALHYFTGSKAHNIAVRLRGRERGLKINEYGVFRGSRRIGGGTEAEVFAAVGLPTIEPELRENLGEIEAAAAGKLPELVRLKDLKGDLHVHSTYTDGTASIREMALAAKACGLSYIAITDHSRRLTVAHGLDSAGLRRQIAEIDRLNAEDLGIRILKGIEVDILPNGSLDLPDGVLAELDLVVAAVHSAFHLDREAQTRRIERALAHHLVTILAHPTGRLIGEREAYDVDMDRIVRAARAHWVILEINSDPERLDLRDVDCRRAKAAGVPVSIDSDAHQVGAFANLAYGVTQARRGWIEAADVVNTRSLEALLRLLEEKRAGQPAVGASTAA